MGPAPAPPRRVQDADVERVLTMTLESAPKQPAALAR
jgi:hypothetical protein